MNSLVNGYARKNVLLTGGLGFIGSNLALRLVRLGARVRIVDSLVPGCGGNYRNIDPVLNEVEVTEADIGDAFRLRPLLKSTDIVFNIAGEVSHSHSMDFPQRDLELNTRSQLAFVQLCADEAPGIRVIYTCTRQVYGRPQYLPVDETHPILPVDINGVNKHAAGMYHVMMSNAGCLDAAVLRLTNIYGPRLALGVPCQGVLSTFLLRILLKQPIELYGDGTQFRDPLYVDDAVNAILKVGAASRLKSRIYNVGGLQPLTLAEIATILCREASAPEPTCRPFPRELAKIDIGSFMSDSSRIATEIDWRPVTPFPAGAARTLEFFRAHLTNYVDPNGAYPRCALRQTLAQGAIASA